METRARGNKLLFKNNGNVYREKVLVPRADYVLLSPDEFDKLQEIPFVTLEGNVNLGVDRPVKTFI